MGRDDVLPKKWFAHLNPKRGNPVYNELIVGVVAYVAVLTVPWQLAAEIVTFGALLAFTAVNLVALLHFWFAASSHSRSLFVDAFLPAFGAVFCFVLLLGLQTWTKYAGLAWLAVGVIYAGYRTRMFTVRPKLFNFNET
jgi:amino acid transporter